MEFGLSIHYFICYSLSSVLIVELLELVQINTAMDPVSPNPDNPVVFFDLTLGGTWMYFDLIAWGLAAASSIFLLFVLASLKA